MRDIRNEVGFLSETVSGLSGAGRAMTFMFTTPLVALGTAAINVASDFQASMYNINAIAGLTGNELEALSQRALEFGANTRSGAQAAADALYTVFSAGLTDPEQAFGAMEVATYTAEAGLADLTTTTEALLSVMLAFGDTSEDMAWRTSNAMTQMVAVGVGSMQDFASALGSVAPTAQGLGMSIEEMMGDMAFLTQRGLSAARAGTALNSALTALIKPTDAMSAAMHNLGAKNSRELIENFGGVNGALKALIEHAGGSQEALAEMFGNIRGLRAINLFAGDIDMWNSSMEEFNNSLDGATMRAWDSQMMSFSATFDKFKASVQGAAISIGTQFFPYLAPILKVLTALTMGIVTMDSKILGLAVGFTTFAAALPPIIWLVTSLINPFGLVLSAVVGLGVAFAINFGGIKDSVVEAVEGASAGLNYLATSMTGFWEALKPPKDIDPFESIDFSVLDDVGGSITLGGGGTTQSLWDLYETSGMMETMNWNEFVEAATDGGWDGGVIDAPITIDTGTGLSDAAIQTQHDIDMIKQSMEGVVPTVEIPFFGRLRAAVDEFVPAIMRSLSWLGSRFLTYFDGLGGSILTAMVMGIEGINTEAIYTAIQALLTGDWTWIAAQFGTGGTELKTAVEGWGAKVEEALPQVTAGLRTLVGTAGAWVVNEGVPLLARSFGFLAGRIGVMLSSAVQAGIAFFTGGGAGDAAGAMSTYVDESIVTPFSEGMQDATAGSDLATGIWDTLGADMTTGMADGVAGIDVGTITAAMGVKLVEIGNWFADTGLANISQGIGYMAGRVSILIGEGMAMALDAVGSFFSGEEPDTSGAVTFGEDIATPFVVGFATALAEGDVTSPLDGFMTAIVGGLVLLATANTFLPVVSAIGLGFKGAATLYSWTATGVSIVTPMMAAAKTAILGWGGFGGIITSIGSGLSSAAAAISAGTTWIAGIATSIGGAIMSAIMVILSSPITMGIVIGTLAYLILPESFKENVRQEIEDAFNWALSDLTGMTWDDVMTTVNSVAIDASSAVVSAVVGDGMTGDERAAAVWEGGDWANFGDDPISLEDYDASYDVALPPPAAISMDLSSSNLIMDDAPLGDGSGITVPTVELSAVQMTFADEILAGADFQTIVTEQLVPLETYWNTMFGEEGTMAASFSAFSTKVTDGWVGADLAANTFLGTISDGVPIAQVTLEAFAGSLTQNMNSVAKELSGTAEEARKLVENIAKLASLDTSLSVQVSIESSGTDGSHKAGLASVPYDGYVAELHKGERVLTATENRDYGGDVQVPSNVLRSESSNVLGGTVVNNTVTIQTAVNARELMRELEREGVYLK